MAFERRCIPAKQPVMKPTRRSAGDPSRLNRVASRRSSLRFGEIHAVFLPHAPCQPGTSPASALTWVPPPAVHHSATRRSSLRFGRNTHGIPPSRALSAGRLAALGAHTTLSTGSSEPVDKVARPGCCEGDAMGSDRAGPAKPVFTTASRPPGPRNCVLLTEKERGDGLERRPLVGIARERETSTDDATPCQCEYRTLFQSRMPRPLTSALSALSGAVPFHDRRGVQEDPIMRVSPGKAGTAVRQGRGRRVARCPDGATLHSANLRGDPWPGLRHGRQQHCAFRPPAAGGADRRSAFQAVPALLLGRRYAVSVRCIPAKQPVMKPTRPSSPGGGSAGDPSRLNRVASRRSSLRFGRNTLGIPPSRACQPGTSPASALRGFHHRLFTTPLRAAHRCGSVGIPESRAAYLPYLGAVGASGHNMLWVAPVTA